MLSRLSDTPSDKMRSHCAPCDALSCNALAAAENKKHTPDTGNNSQRLLTDSQHTAALARLDRDCLDKLCVRVCVNAQAACSVAADK